jgi:hypothetical protein
MIPKGSRELAIGSGLIACEAEHSRALGGTLAPLFSARLRAWDEWRRQLADKLTAFGVEPRSSAMDPARYLQEADKA